jgi:hypothetical protein
VTRDEGLEELASGEVGGISWRLKAAHEGSQLRLKVTTTTPNKIGGGGIVDDNFRPGELLRIFSQLRSPAVHVVVGKVAREVEAIHGCTESGRHIVGQRAVWAELPYDLFVIAANSKIAEAVAHDRSGAVIAKRYTARPRDHLKGTDR